MMVVMPAPVGVGALPPSRAVAVAEREEAAEGTRHEVQRLVVVAPDGRTLVGGEGEPALVEDVERAAAVPAAVLPARLPEVVEERGDGDAVRGEASRVRGHVVVHLDGVLRKPAALLVVAVAAAREVVR